MIKRIRTEEDLEFYLPQLAERYREMFSEAPFNNPSITKEQAEKTFRNTFKNGILIVKINALTRGVFGFRTMLKSESFSDFGKFDLKKDSYYLSGLWIHPTQRGKGYGNKLLQASLDIARISEGVNKFYVRTRKDTPQIHELLKKNGFKVFEEYSTEFNNTPVELMMWESCLED